jgi:HD superfamily phosphohydrolase
MASRYPELVAQLSAECPKLWQSICRLTDKWLSKFLQRLDDDKDLPRFPKVFNDPVWGTVELMPWEVAVLDSTLVQRLRGVRQLGMAHYVFPGAGHDRLEHIRGVVEAADLIVRRLERNAGHRRDYDDDTAIPQITVDDWYVVRLAALLHDIGHGPFSHAIEPTIEERNPTELKKLRASLRSFFEGVADISVSEAIASLMILSPKTQLVFNHANFRFRASKEDLAMRVVARIIGARNHLKASYLSGVVSGPIDADKFDYMARDSHHAGLPLNLDTDRLISKLEVITITPENVPATQEELRKRAESAAARRIYDIGISLSGIGAYEQMLVNRVLLYDRLYYHHKVRVADAMAQRLVLLAEEERGRPFDIDELYLGVADDTLVAVLGGLLKTDEVEGGGPRSRELAERILQRRLYRRAFAFAVRFIAGFEGWAETAKDQEKAAIWPQVAKGLSTFEDVVGFEREIHQTAIEIAQALVDTDPAMRDLAEALRPEHIIVDLPANKVKPGGNLLLTRTESDQVGLPNLFFDPERWSNAYDQQKRCGYVFCAAEFRPLVNLAARIAMFRRYRVAMGENADRLTKTAGVTHEEWLQTLKNKGVIDIECFTQIRQPRTILSRIEPADIDLPVTWLADYPDIKTDIAEAIREGRPGGFAVDVKSAFLTTLTQMAAFVDMVVQGGEFAHLAKLPEKDLQKELRKALRSASIPVTEGAEVAGGETDLISCGMILIENKVAGRLTDPMAAKPASPFQARRYSLSLCQSVYFTVVAYEPAGEESLVPNSRSIQVRPVDGISDCVQVRVVVPYNTGDPSAAKAAKQPQRTPAPAAAGR